MKNLWPVKFEANSQRSPKSILEEQAGFLATITGSIVVAQVSQLSKIDAFRRFRRQGEFNFRLDLIAPFLENYKFTLLLVSHDIMLYPVQIWVSENVGSELGLKKGVMGSEKTVESPEAFEAFLEEIFQSEHIKKVIGSILALSK